MLLMNSETGLGADRTANIVLVSLAALALVAALLAAFVVVDLRTDETEKSMSYTHPIVGYLSDDPTQAEQEIAGIDALMSGLWGGTWGDYLDCVERHYPNWKTLYPDDETRKLNILYELAYEANKKSDWDWLAKHNRTPPYKHGFWRSDRVIVLEFLLEKANQFSIQPEFSQDCYDYRGTVPSVEVPIARSASIIN